MLVSRDGLLFSLLVRESRGRRRSLCSHGLPNRARGADYHWEGFGPPSVVPWLSEGYFVLQRQLDAGPYAFVAVCVPFQIVLDFLISS